MDPDYGPHTDMAQLGGNLAGLVEAGVVTAMSLAALGFAVPCIVVRLLNDGIADPRRHDDPCCGTRHHYSYCCEPPCYGCRR